MWYGISIGCAGISTYRMWRHIYLVYVAAYLLIYLSWWLISIYLSILDIGSGLSCGRINYVELAWVPILFFVMRLFWCLSGIHRFSEHDVLSEIELPIDMISIGAICALKFAYQIMWLLSTYGYSFTCVILVPVRCDWISPIGSEDISSKACIWIVPCMHHSFWDHRCVERWCSTILSLCTCFAFIYTCTCVHTCCKFRSNSGVHRLVAVAVVVAAVIV